MEPDAIAMDAGRGGLRGRALAWVESIPVQRFRVWFSCLPT